MDRTINQRSLTEKRDRLQQLVLNRALAQQQPGMIAQKSTEAQQLWARESLMLRTANDSLAILQEFEPQNQDLINNNEDVRLYLELHNAEARLGRIEEQYGRLFQQAEIVTQQIFLTATEERTNALFPNVTDETFWSHVYRKVAADPNNLNGWIVSYYLFE